MKQTPNQKITVKLEAEDVTPTWEGLMTWFIEVLQDPKQVKAQATIKPELHRLARIGDAYNTHLKNLAAGHGKIIEAMDFLLLQINDSKYLRHKDKIDEIKQLLLNLKLTYENEKLATKSR